MFRKNLIHFILTAVCLSTATAQDKKLEELLKGKDLFISLKLIDSMGKIGTSKDPQTGILYQNIRIEICKRFNNDTCLALAYWKKGTSLRKRGELEEAEICLKQAEQLYKKAGNISGEITTLMGLGNLYQQKGIIDAALNFFYKSISLAEKHKKFDALGANYVNIGTAYLAQEDLDKAEEFYKKGLEEYKKTGVKSNIALILDNLGNVQTRRNNYRKALEYHLEALVYLEELNDKTYLGEAYINLGGVYIELNEFKDAKIYLHKAEEIFLELEYPLGLALINANLGEIEVKQRKYNDAIVFLEKGLKYAQDAGSNDFVKSMYNSLYEVYEKKNEPALALKYYKEYVRFKDTILNLESTKQINELTERFQSKQKQQEIDLLTKDKVISESKIEQNKLVNTALIIGIGLALVLFTMSYFRYRDKKKAHLLLEGKNKIIEEKQKEIFDSLQYARQIQKLLLANHKLVNETLPDSFIVFKPKDIVSGDFYWAAKKEERFYLAVCDSTGHGVPGAFMSLLNINFLNEAIMEKNIEKPNHVLDHVRKRLIDNISQNGRQDGMDGILLCVNEETKQISYAAANNAPVIISNGKLTVLDADKMPVGKGEKNDPFNLYDLQLKKGDMIILYTDGYADQFGGPKGKKFKYKPLNDMLLKNHELPVIEQETHLYNEFDKWKGSLEQVDDVCILGIRL